MKTNIRKLVMAALMLALCLVLPFITGQIPQIGSALSPMHIPVLLCGFICGPVYGLAVGLIAPPLRYVLFGMPPIFPVGTAMMFEMAVYGLAAGLLYRLLPKKNVFVYVALAISMLLGRLVGGAANYIIAGISGGSFTAQMFIAGYFVNALPGIVLHMILVPLVFFGLRAAKLTANE
jgi:riboflavin transporter FmnP